MWTLSPQGMGGPAPCPSPFPPAPPQRAAARAPPTFTQPALRLIHPNGVWLPPSPQDISPLWCPLPTTHTRLTSVGKGDGAWGRGLDAGGWRGWPVSGLQTQAHPRDLGQGLLPGLASHLRGQRGQLPQSTAARRLPPSLSRHLTELWGARIEAFSQQLHVLRAPHAPLPPLMTGCLRFREVNGSARLVYWRLSWIQTMVWATPSPYILLLLALIGPSSWLKLSVVLRRGWTQRCKVRSFVARQAPLTLCPSCGCPTIPCPPALQYCTPARTLPSCKLYAFIFH